MAGRHGECLENTVLWETVQSIIAEKLRLVLKSVDVSKLRLWRTRDYFSFWVFSPKEIFFSPKGNKIALSRKLFY